MVVSSWLVIGLAALLLILAIGVMLIVAIASKSKGGAAVAVVLLAVGLLVVPCLVVAGWLFVRVDVVQPMPVSPTAVPTAMPAQPAAAPYDNPPDALTVDEESGEANALQAADSAVDPLPTGVNP